MKKHSHKLVQLFESYNRSTNLQLDFNDSNRLKNIYLSSKFQTGLRDVLKSILETNSNHRVRVLSGSPGLGKSTFALFATQTVSKKYPKIIKELLKSTDSPLKELFDKFQKSDDTKLLPVFINGYEGELGEVFIQKLCQSLKQWGFSKNLSPKNSSKNVLAFYQSAIDFLKKKGYGGIFVVYDEFGKYLERAIHNPDNLNIQFLQNFAEFCDRSGAHQCHLTLITHLSISQYAYQLPFHIQREWAKIEGRFSESAFYDKNFDYYKMIVSVFKKNITETAPILTRKYKTYIKKYRLGFQAEAFFGFMNSKSAEQTLLDCFPLHPSVLSLLPHLSMKVAQNERTLYTFLTRDENYSLKSFLDERFKNENTLLMPYDLYQYFQPLIGKDVGIGGSYKIQIMVEEAWAKIDGKDEVSKQIISLMALCSVIKNTHFAPLTEEFIISCFNQTFSEKPIKKSLKMLRHKKVIFYNKRAKQYLLQEGSPVDIDEEIAKLKKTELTGKKLVQVLKRSFKPDFIVPKKYNLDQAITRFYRTELISVEELKNFVKNHKVDFYKEDGRVFYVIPFSYEEWVYAKLEIQKNLSSLVVFVLPNKFIECKKDIEELNAVDCLSSNKEIVSASPLVKKELDRHKDILLSSLRSLLRPLMGYMSLSVTVGYSTRAESNEPKICWKEITHFKELQRFLSDLFEQEYRKYIRFNLEYVNRHRVSGAVTLGRKKFIDLLIDYKKDPSKNMQDLIKGHGPDYALFNIMKHLSGFKFNKEEKIYKVFSKSDFEIFFREYKKILAEHSNGITGKELMDILVAPPYGLRLGVVPVFMALADLCLKQPVSHYFDSAYVKNLTGDHYDLLMKYPRKTAIHWTFISQKQQQFLDGLRKIFEAEDGSIHSVISTLIKWRKTVPESTKLSSDLSQAGRKMLIQIDSSKQPDQLIFKGIPECFAPSEHHKVDFVQPVTSAKSDKTQLDISAKGVKGYNEVLSLTKAVKQEIEQVYKNLLLKIKQDLEVFMIWADTLFIEQKSVKSLKTDFKEAKGATLGGFSASKAEIKQANYGSSCERGSKKTSILLKTTHLNQNTGHKSSRGFKQGPSDLFIKDFQNILARIKSYPLSVGAGHFVGRALNFDSSNHLQYFLETMADVLTGSSPRHWDSKGYSKFNFALKKIKTEVELACEVANPCFKGQSVLAFIDRGADKKTFVKLGVSGIAKNKQTNTKGHLDRSVQKIQHILSDLDEIDQKKVIISVLESFEKNLSTCHSRERHSMPRGNLSHFEG